MPAEQNKSRSLWWNIWICLSRELLTSHIKLFFYYIINFLKCNKSIENNNLQEVNA